MPGEEEGVEVHVLRAVDVDDGVVHVSVDSSWICVLIELGWFPLQTFHGVGVGLSLLRWHLVEVDSGFDVFSITSAISPAAISGSVSCWCCSDKWSRKDGCETNKGQERAKHDGQQ